MACTPYIKNIFFYLNFRKINFNFGIQYSISGSDKLYSNLKTATTDDINIHQLMLPRQHFLHYTMNNKNSILEDNSILFSLFCQIFSPSVSVFQFLSCVN